MKVLASQMVEKLLEFAVSLGKISIMLKDPKYQNLVKIINISQYKS